MFPSKTNFSIKFAIIFALLFTFSFRLHSQTNITTIVDAKNIEMVLVPAGEFEMGANIEDAVAFCSTLYTEENGCDITVFREIQLVNQYLRQIVSS